jgi:hypothetical protein
MSTYLPSHSYLAQVTEQIRLGKQLRVRFDRGWTSTVAKDGRTLLRELKI